VLQQKFHPQHRDLHCLYECDWAVTWNIAAFAVSEVLSAVSRWSFAGGDSGGRQHDHRQTPPARIQYFIFYLLA
jgi:hypothetical protein